LGRFFEAIQLGEVLDAIGDINRAAANRLQTAKFGHNTETVADVQTKVEWLEVFFVGFYATELSRIITELLRLSHDSALITVIIVGVVFTAGAYYALQPWRHGSKKPIVIILLLAVLWALGFLARGNVPPNLLEPQ